MSDQHGDKATAALVREVRRALRLRDEGESVLSNVANILGGWANCQVAAYRPERAPAGWSFHDAASCGGHARRCLALGAVAVRSASSQFAIFNPLSVQVDQRNQVLGPRECARRLELAGEEVHRWVAMTQGAAGLTGVSHMRVVLSNGAEMLSWLGMWRDQPFTASEERALGAVVPRIASRLALEQKLRFRGVTGFAALAASLDIVSDPVLMLSAAGRVVYANPGGVAQLDGDPNLVAQVYDHVRGRVPSPRVYGHTVLKGRGLHAHHVVVLRPYADPPDRLMAAQQWGLTATEQRVLGELLTGAANKEIALRLGCAPRTVEVHVGAILRKARCESRSQLLAAFRRR